VNYFKAVLSSLVLSSLLSCSEHTSKNAAHDFAFIIQDEQNRYDSKAGRFTRFYAGKDSTVQLRLDSIELNQIHNLFVEYSFHEFPSEFIGNCTLIPVFRTTLSFTEKGLNYQSIMTDPCDYALLQWRQIHRFKRLEKTIWQIVLKKDAVRLMRASDMFFL
jgi:hypothetical protein